MQLFHHFKLDFRGSRAATARCSPLIPRTHSRRSGLEQQLAPPGPPPGANPTGDESWEDEGEAKRSAVPKRCRRPAVTGENSAALQGEGNLGEACGQRGLAPARREQTDSQITPAASTQAAYLASGFWTAAGSPRPDGRAAEVRTQ